MVSVRRPPKIVLDSPRPDRPL